VTEKGAGKGVSTFGQATKNLTWTGMSCTWAVTARQQPPSTVPQEGGGCACGRGTLIIPRHPFNRLRPPTDKTTAPHTQQYPPKLQALRATVQCPGVALGGPGAPVLLHDARPVGGGHTGGGGQGRRRRRGCALRHGRGGRGGQGESPRRRRGDGGGEGG
jgi:hypothetical protein